MLPQIVTVNPFMAQRRRARHKRAHNRFRYRAKRTSRAKNSFRRRRHRVSNPFNLKGLTGSLMPALIGAGGAIGTDIAMAYAAPYLPAAVQSGWLNILARAAVAVGVGYAAGMATNKQTGKEVAAGGLVVVAYSALKQALAPTLGKSVKGLSGLADFADYSPAVSYGQQPAAMIGSGMGAYMQHPMGAYMQPRLGAYMSPGSVMSPGNSPIAAKQRALAGFGGFGGYDSDSM